MANFSASMAVRPGRSQRRAHLVAHDLLDLADVVDEVVQALVRQQAAVGVVGIADVRGDGVGGIGKALVLGQPAEVRAVEGDGGLDDGEADLLVQIEDVLRALLGVAGIGMRQGLRRILRAVDADAVAHLAAQQLIDGHARLLAGDVPQRHLDGADELAPGLERAQAPDAAHDVLDIGGIAAHDHVAEVGHVDVDEVLVLLDLGIAVDSLVGLHAQADVIADDRALEVRDLHETPPFCVVLSLFAGRIRPVLTIPQRVRSVNPKTRLNPGT